jgi:hypothetical protein
VFAVSTLHIAYHSSTYQISEAGNGAGLPSSPPSVRKPRQRYHWKGHLSTKLMPLSELFYLENGQTCATLKFACRRIFFCHFLLAMKIKISLLCLCG